MTTEEVYQELQKISEQIEACERNRDWQRRKALIPKYRKLYRSHKFPFQAGEMVEVTEGHRWVPARVIERTPENYFVIKKGEFVMSQQVTGFMLRYPKVAGETGWDKLF